ncbi:MAG: hypothetical protein EBS18_01245 [Actinobacteria bacterium]|nr:hypothetical protein [Actinomycetota bacterium]
MNYGKWNGQKLENLSKKRDWKAIQTAPATFKFPEGESFIQMRNRVQNFLTEVSGLAGPILVISHGDVIKMFLTCTLNQPINTFQKFAITPASLSIIEYSRANMSVISTNHRLGQSLISDRLTKFLPGGENA